MTLFKNKNEYFIDEAKKILENSGLVAFLPRLYALGADARNENACTELKEGLRYNPWLYILEW